MYKVGGFCWSVGRCGGRSQILALLAILGATSAVAGAQIDVNETGLHDGASVYGLYAPPAPIPYVNLLDITLFAWGETNPDLYPNVSFSAYGLHGETGVDNGGWIDVVATGGNAHASGSTIASAGVWAYGMYTLGGVTNTGDLRITAAGGAADANTHAEAYSIIQAIYARGDVNNTGDITITATGGNAHTNAGNANALGGADGIYASHGLITNTGRIDIVATGGTALVESTSSGSQAIARAGATSLSFWDAALDNAGELRVTAQGGSATGSNYADATADADGIGASHGDADNRGDIMAIALGGRADGGNSARTDATSMAIMVHGGYAHNTGDLTALGVGGTATAGGSGDAALASADSYGAGINTSGIATNSGTISVTARGGSADANSGVSLNSIARASARGYGISADSGVGNSGTITGIVTGGTAAGDEIADASARAYGVRAGGASYNDGLIDVTAVGGAATTGPGVADANAFTYGFWTSGTLDNRGNLIITATGGTATGPSAYGETQAFGLSGINLTNTGAVTVAAAGGTATASDFARTCVYAEGIGGSPVTNTGAISVTATAGHATGDTVRADVMAVGISAGDTVHNSGAITATATTWEGSTSTAYGIRMNSYGNLTNTGVIRASADTAYELYVASGMTTLVDTYNVTLDGDPNRASLGVADGATLALNDATLTVAAVTGETLWDTEYELFETEGTGAVDGNFAEARAVNPNTTAVYHDQGTAASVDDTVSLAFTPVGAAPLASAAAQKQLITQAGDAVNHHMATMLLQNLLSPSASGLLASAGSTAESIALAEAAAGKPAGVFVEPYYSLLDHDANPLGYDARLWGFSAGYERYFENTLLGLHVGYGHSDIDYTGAGFSGNSEDQDVVTGGFCGLTRWEPWILDYGVTAFYGSQDYEGRTGLALDEQETASYHSYGTATTLMAGRLLRWGPHVFLPEVGLDWLWVHRPQYTTEATDPSFDTTYSTQDDHDVYAAAALQWMSSFLHDDVRVTPSLALGVRYLLTDDETSTVVSIPGAAPVLVESEQNRTALTLSGALTLTRTPHALSLAYDGDYSPDLQRHSVWLRYTRLF